MEDDRPGGTFIDVLALCFLTHDLTVVCPHGFMRPLAERCHAAYGVAHFLFHPSHIEDPECERSIRETVAYTRSLGMEWWTCEEINNWERARRRVAISSEGSGAAEQDRSYRIQAPARLSEATLLFLLPGDRSPTPAITVDGETVPVSKVKRYGHHFAQITADLVHLSNGDILLTYGNRNPPYRIEGRISRDGGRSWLDLLLTFSGHLYGYTEEESRSTDLGYPSSVVRGGGNGEGITMYYYNPSMRGRLDARKRAQNFLYFHQNYCAVAITWQEEELIAAVQNAISGS